MIGLDARRRNGRNISAQLRYVHRLVSDRQNPHVGVGRYVNVVCHLDASIVVCHCIQMKWRLRHDALRRLHAALKFSAIDAEHVERDSFSVGILVHDGEELRPRLGLCKQWLGAEHLDHMSAAKGW